MSKWVREREVGSLTAAVRTQLRGSNWGWWEEGTCSRLERLPARDKVPRRLAGCVSMLARKLLFPRSRGLGSQVLCRAVRTPHLFWFARSGGAQPRLMLRLIRDGREYKCRGL